MTEFEDVAQPPDWKTVRQELLRAIRGKRSQNALNRKLGSAQNQISRWETGRVRILWGEFVDLCMACRVDIACALTKATGFTGDPKNVGAALNHLLGTEEVNSDTRGDFATAKRLRLYWIDVARQSLEEMRTVPPPGEAFEMLFIFGLELGECLRDLSLVSHLADNKIPRFL